MTELTITLGVPAFVHIYVLCIYIYNTRFTNTQDSSSVLNISNPHWHYECKRTYVTSPLMFMRKLDYYILNYGYTGL